MLDFSKTATRSGWQINKVVLSTGHHKRGSEFTVATTTGNRLSRGRIPNLINDEWYLDKGQGAELAAISQVFVGYYSLVISYCSLPCGQTTNNK